MANFIISFLSFFFFIFTACFSIPTSVTSSLSSYETDLVSLLAIKSSLNDPKGALNSWNQTATHYCNWTGIKCSRRHPNRVVGIKLESQDLVGSLSPYIGNLSFLQYINLENNTFNGQIPQEISRLRRLEIVHSPQNSFVGPIPKNLSTCTNLFFFNLIKNKLSRTIPNELGSLHKLEVLGLGGNTFSGHIPSFLGNLTSLRKLHLGSCFSQGRGIPESFVQLKRLNTLVLSGNNLTDLLKATSGFSESNLIGVGRFGSVYKGTLDDRSTLVAVKVLNLFVQGASKSFMAECKALRGARHRNLVKILSVCESIDFQVNDFKALVYQFKANGSLEKWLYHYTEGEEVMRRLSMIQRLNIAIDTAQGIEYLHFGMDSTIVHGDLKPSNILLDDEMTACVGDFGLAKIVSDIIPSHESSSSIGIRGTLGYIPPEYGMNNSVSMQGDVYSYGIVLLEIFTNKKPTDDFFKDHGNLHSFVSAALPDHAMEIVDPLLQAELDMENSKIKDCMTSILSIGVSCSKEIPKNRLSMIDVVIDLHKIKRLLSS